jgi:hypothetical protein
MRGGRLFDPMSLHCVLQEPLQLASVGPSESKRRPILQNQDLLSPIPRLQRCDPVKVHDRRALDSDELLRVQPWFQSIHGRPQKMALHQAFRYGVAHDYLYLILFNISD